MKDNKNDQPGTTPSQSQGMFEVSLRLRFKSGFRIRHACQVKLNKLCKKHKPVHRDQGFNSSILFLSDNGKTRRNQGRVSFTGRA